MKPFVVIKLAAIGSSFARNTLLRKELLAFISVVLVSAVTGDWRVTE
jgi:hypothetical protein